MRKRRNARWKRKCRCGEHKPKKELVRIVRDTDGGFSVDLTGKKNGRGAYICKNVSCLQVAQKKHLLERSFSCQIPVAVYAQLEEEMHGDNK